jgi:hypothetical protein
MFSSIEVLYYAVLYRSFVLRFPVYKLYFCCPVIGILCYVVQHRSFVLCCPV